jgi:hypothetical protein
MPSKQVLTPSLKSTRLMKKLARLGLVGCDKRQLVSGFVSLLSSPKQEGPRFESKENDCQSD